MALPGQAVAEVEPGGAPSRTSRRRSAPCAGVLAIRAVLPVELSPVGADAEAKLAMDGRKVSVVMPVYNCQRYLAAAVESILGQTFRDFEFIIIDDGSTDGSLSLLQGFAERDDRIRLVSRPNTGIVGALNEGLAMARGEFIARMDGDDVSFPTRLERQVEYLQSHPECVAIGAKVNRVCPAGLKCAVTPRVTAHAQIEERLLLGEGGAMVHPVVMMRATVVRSIGGYREKYRYVEDLDLFLRLGEVGRLANLDEILLDYREHLASTNHTKHREQEMLRCTAVAEAHRRRNRDARPDGQLAPYVLPDPQARLRGWGWNALRSGRRWLAFRYAMSSLRLEPFSGKTYRLMACIVRGY
jgi:GT2 family glycosyltransferase